nr:ADP-ribosylglycohydrolase family protein [uncultured Allomuricauda sp.]
MRTFFTVLIFGILMTGCKPKSQKIDIPAPKNQAYVEDFLNLNDTVYYDKVMGALVGSAIGDAMGASTEMWHRKDIQLQYGYINGLTPLVRDQSPEGPWAHNLLAGATTDDTRWKYLMGKYFQSHKEDLSASNFAAFISSYHSSLTNELGEKSIQKNPDSLDAQIEKIDWIKEWAKVATAFQKDSKTYVEAQNRFYGGEMSCAGQLYTSMFGLIAKSPSEAYELAYQHSLFDIGYAKDISSLVSVLTHMAMRTQSMDSILNTVAFVDPKRYQDSRLIGRIPYALLDNAQKSVRSIKQQLLVDSLIVKDSITFKIPKGFERSPTNWARQEMVYQMLEKEQRAIAFHSAEIWQILVTALEFGQGDFEKTMQFIVNYGRDNDTVAAIAGMILGAKVGYHNLPDDLKEEVLRVNKENLGIDLEALAREIASIEK